MTDPISRDEFYRLAQDNPHAHAGLMMYRQGVITWEDMLLRVVLAVAHENSQLKAKLTDVMARIPGPPWHQE